MILLPYLYLVNVSYRYPVFHLRSLTVILQSYSYHRSHFFQSRLLEIAYPTFSFVVYMTCMKRTFFE